MLPYFFRKPTVTEDRGAIKFHAQQRRAPVIKRAPRPGLFKRIIQALTPRNLTLADRSAIGRAESKRERRRDRNRKWWAADRTWEFYGGTR